MHKARHTIFHLLLIIFTVAFTPTKSQVTPGFTMDKSSGCPPLIVQFTNTSTGSGTLTYVWKFGDNASSIEINPGKTYANPGTYTVTLIATNGTDTDSIKKQVVVHQPPTANFTSIRKGCVPLEVQFTDLSQKGSSDIDSWRWDLRTGDILNEQNPLVTYNFKGLYDVFLEITDKNNCTGSIDRPNYIDVAAWPVSAFTASPSVACEAPATIQFSNTSTGPGVLSYEWDFGNSSTSDELNPSNTYTNYGSYPVQLIVNSDYVCSDTSSLTVYVQEVVAEGILKQDNTEVTTGTDICPGEIDYEVTTPGATKVKWIFDSEGSSALTKGKFIVQKAGTYKVLLIVEPLTPCADTIEWILTVDNIKADFTQPVDYSCQSPLDITFTNTSVNAVSSAWTFDNGSTSNETNGQVSYAVPPKADPYSINEPVIFNTQLEVTSAKNCKSRITKSLTIKKPTAVFTATKTSGCIPLEVTFKDQSLSDQKIVQWEWVKGDGTSEKKTIDTIAITYPNDGDFPARLVITNQLGCTDTSYAILIEAGKSLLPDFTASATVFCQGDEITFHDQTPEKQLIDGWRYFINAIPVSTPVADSSPVWVADADTGKLDVKLAVNYNGCITEKLKPAFLQQSGAVADFNFGVDCSSPLAVNFINQSKDYDSFEWSFGEGTTDNLNPNPSNTYLTEGNYTVQLISHKGACSDTMHKTVRVRQPKAVLLADTISCAGSETVYSAFGSFPAPIDYCHERYLWLPGNGYQPRRTFDDSLLYQIDERGIHQVRVVAFYDT